MAKRRKNKGSSGTTRYDLPTLKPLTEAQDRYLKAIKSSTLVLSYGPAGTGKTFVAGGYAAHQLHNRQIDQIVITRPIVEAGERLGFLPGELEDKVDPYMQPFMDVFEYFFGKSYTEYLLKAGKIVIRPLAYLRGVTFRNSLVILDEAQNTSKTQMKMFLTRIGENTTMVIDGDINQTDIPGTSGLYHAIRQLRHINGCKVIEFTHEDIVRHGIVRDILLAWDSPSLDSLSLDSPSSDSPSLLML